MTHPQYRLARRVPVAPDAVLVAIADVIAGTERRDLPPHLQRGVRGLSGNVRGQRFTVRLVEAIRASIETGDFDAFRTEFLGGFYASKR